MTVLYAMLAPTLLRMGCRETAAELVEAGLAIVERNDERIFEAELHRLAATVKGLEPEPSAIDEANAALQRGLDVARAQGAHALERRCRADASRLAAATRVLGEYGETTGR
jgi:hypothetical protein